MRKAQGYASFFGVGPALEHDTVTCGHCQRIVLVKAGTGATVYVTPQLVGPPLEEPGAMCRVCMRPVCLACHAKGRCTPFERRIEQMEARGRLLRQVGVAVLLVFALPALVRGADAVPAVPVVELAVLPGAPVDDVPSLALEPLPIDQFISGGRLTGVATTPSTPSAFTLCTDAGANAVYIKAAATGSGTGADWTNATTLPSSPARNKVYCLADGAYSGYSATYPNVSGTQRVTFAKASVADHGTPNGWSDALGDGVADFPNFHIAQGTPSYVTVNGYSSSVVGNQGITITYVSDGEGFRIRDNLTELTIMYARCIGPASGGADFWCLNAGYVSPMVPRSNLLFSHITATGGSTCFRIRESSNVIFEYMDCSDYDTSAGGDHANALYSELCLNCTLRYSYFHNIATEGLLITCPGASCVLPGDNSSWDIYGNIFANAKALSNGRAIETHQAFTSNPGPINLYNNTFYNFTEQACLALAGGVSSGSVAYNNLFYNCSSGGGTGISAYPTHDYTWTRGSGTVTESNVQNGAGDPFVNAAGGDFHLNAQTTAGFTLSGPFNLDRDGVTRGSSGGWDRGAYEKASSPEPIPLYPNTSRFMERARFAPVRNSAVYSASLISGRKGVRHETSPYWSVATGRVGRSGARRWGAGV